MNTKWYDNKPHGRREAAYRDTAHEALTEFRSNYAAQMIPESFHMIGNMIRKLERGIKWEHLNDPSPPTHPVVSDPATTVRLQTPETAPIPKHWSQFLHLADEINWEEVSNAPCRVMRRIPHAIKGDSQAMFSDLLGRIAKTPKDSDDAKRLEMVLLNLPKLLWMIPNVPKDQLPGKDIPHTETSKEAAKPRNAKVRIQMFQNGAWEALVETIVARTQTRPRTVAQNEVSLLEKLNETIQAGNLSRAANLLTSVGVAPPTQHNIQSVGKLFAPKPEEDMPKQSQWPLDSYRTENTVNSSEVGRTIRKSKHGKAHDIHGWAYEHFKLLVREDKDTAAFTILINKINADDLHDDSYHHMCTGRITPLKKNEEGTKSRPILRSNVLRCLASNALLARYTKHFAQVLGPQQHAIGKSAAAELIARKLQEYVKENPEHAILQLDATNAFSCVDRHAALQQLASVAPALASVATIWLSRASVGIIHDQKGRT